MVHLCIIIGVTQTVPGIADAILEEIAPIVARAKHAWAARCQERGLSLTHFQVLSILDRSGPMPMSHLAEHLGVSLPNATGIISRMEERGVVERLHDATDRRVVVVQPTQVGLEFSRELGDVRRTQLTALIGALTLEQQENLLRAVRDLRAVIDQPTSQPVSKEPLPA
jgi:DNA-binding MarR family transcriptional regulator